LSGSAILRCVPKVDAFSVHGLVLRFFSHDHMPPHFHAEKPSQWEVRVRFRLAPSEMIEVLSKKQPRPSELKELTKLAEAHRVALMDEWDAKVSVNEPGADR
jgi:hypothetical protein